MSEPTIPGPETPEEAAARERILADLKQAFEDGEEVARRYWGVSIDTDWQYTRCESLCLCPLARQLIGYPATRHRVSLTGDVALLLRVDPVWVLGFLQGWDSGVYRGPSVGERAYFWGFAAGIAAREIEPCAPEESP